MKTLLLLSALAAAPAHAVGITGGAGVFTGLMPWSIGTDIALGAHASLGVRLTDHLGAVVAAQLLTAHLDNHNQDHPYDWQRWLGAIGVAAQLDSSRFQLAIGGGLAALDQCVPSALVGHPCQPDSRQGPALMATASYAVFGPVRAELSASWFAIRDQYGGRSGSIAAGVGAGF